MNKLFTKVAALSVGLAMAIGVGVALGGRKSALRVKADTADGFVSDANGKGTANTGSEMTATSDGVSLTFSKGYGYSASQTRSYAGGSITLSYDSSVSSVSAVSMTVASDKNGGTWTGATLSNTTVTWDATAKDTTVSHTAQARISAISVTYTPGSEPGVTYTITYDANGGTGTMADTTNTVAECTFTAPEGKVFSKWNTAADGTGTNYNPGAKASSDLDLFAIWEDNPYSHAGTAEDPFTVAEGILKCKENGTTAGGPWVVKGIISKKTTWDSRYTNVTYWISDDGTGEDSKTTTIECFRGKYLEGADVTSSNEGEFAVGKIVTVTGNLINYGGNTPEYVAGNYPLSIEEPAATKYSVISRIDNGSLSVSEIYENTELKVSIVPELGYFYPSSLTFVRVAGSDVPYTYEKGVVTVEASRITGNVTIEGTCVACNPIKSLYAMPDSAPVGSFYGVYVGFAIGSGPVIMDGEYGILLFKSDQDVTGWVEGETIIHVQSGTISIYNGLVEVKNYTLETVESAEVSAPVVHTTTGSETTLEANRLTNATGFVATAPSKGNFTDPAGTSDIQFTYTVGDNTFTVYYKKASQTDEVISTLAGSLENGTEIVLKGFTGWYKSFQLTMIGLVEASEDYTAEQFAQELLDLTDAVCEGYEEGDNNHDALEAIWSTLAGADKYPSLPAAEKTILAEAERDESGTVVERAMARYDFLTGKYNLNNFINGRTPVAARGNFDYSNEANSNTTMIVIVAIAAVSAISLAALLVIKKRKHN